jgi:membrane protease YdiL (CAAX protease family)
MWIMASDRRGKSVLVFYALACAVSWTLWMPMVLGQDGLRVLRIAPSPAITISLGTVGPFVACFLTHRFGTGKWNAVRLWSPDPLRLGWVLLGPAAVAACWFVVFPCLATTGGFRPWHWHPRALSAVVGSMFGLGILGGPLFEEFGWRGFLQSRLQEQMAPWLAGLCVGVMWAAWHGPLFLVAGWSSASPPAFVAILTGLSLVIAAGFNGSGRLVPVAVLMHSAFNASPRALGDYLQGSVIRDYPPGDWLIAAALLLSGAVAVLLTRGRLLAAGRSRRTASRL